MLRSSTTNLNSLFGQRNENRQRDEDNDNDVIEDPFEIEVDNDFQDYDLMNDNYSEQDENELNNIDADLDLLVDSQEPVNRFTSAAAAASSSGSKQTETTRRQSLDIREQPGNASSGSIGHRTIYRGVNCEPVKMSGVLKPVDTLRKLKFNNTKIVVLYGLNIIYIINI